MPCRKNVPPAARRQIAKMFNKVFIPYLLYKIQRHPIAASTSEVVCYGVGVAGTAAPTQVKTRLSLGAPAEL